MKHLSLLALTYAALVAQTTLAAQMEIRGITPYLPLVPFLAAVGCCEGASLLIWSAIIGLGCDCLGTGALGREMGVLAVVAVTIGAVLPQRSSKSPLFTFLFGFLIAATALFLSSSLDVALNRREIVVTALLRQIAGCAAYTALVAAIGRALWNTILRISSSPFAALRPLRT